MTSIQYNNNNLLETKTINSKTGVLAGVQTTSMCFFYTSTQSLRDDTES